MKWRIALEVVRVLAAALLATGASQAVAPSAVDLAPAVAAELRQSGS